VGAAGREHHSAVRGHHGEEQFGEQEGAETVRRERQLVAVRAISHFPVEATPRIAEHRVQLLDLPALDHCLARGGGVAHRGERGGVEFDCGHGDVADRPQFLGDGLHACRAATGEDDVGPAGGELSGTFEADAGMAAGDKYGRHNATLLDDDADGVLPSARRICAV
jgi:hypothetical protein